MIYYVSHAYVGDPENLEKAKKITHDLQINDQSQEICPLGSGCKNQDTLSR